MNDAIIQNQFSKALLAYKQGTVDDTALLKKFDHLITENDFTSAQSIAELTNLITEANLPEQLCNQLLSNFSTPKTVIINPSAVHPPHETDALDEHKEHDSSSRSSSLLRNLMQWSEGDRNKEIVPNQIIRNTYRIVESIGRGGMGEVWKAIDLIQDAGDSQDKYVAIKFISHEIRSHPFALKALVREFARYKKLIHPNIVKAYELNRDETEVFIVMEFLEGMSLKKYIKQHPNGIPLKQAEPIIKGMCNALSYAHQEGIIHLDFKPGNVFYNPQTKVAKVIDFGIARLSKQRDRDKTRFDPGKLGAITTAYASIEMLMEADPDPRDDVYGLACVVYELLSGKHPFNGDIAIKAERGKKQPQPIKGVDKEVFQALCRGLSFDRKKRTPSAEQFYQELFAPQESAKKKLIHQLINGSIIALAAIVIPILIYQAYDYWDNQRVITAIHELNADGIKDFQSLSATEQLELLDNDRTRLALVQYPISSQNYAIDALEFIQSFDPKIQKLLLKQRDIRALLIDHYLDKVDHFLSTDNFSLAQTYASKIIAIYPDSKALSELNARIQPLRLKRVQELERSYRQCLHQKNKSLLELKPCLQESRQLLANTSPQHELLNDQNLLARYAKETSSALRKNDLLTTEKLLTDWHELMPKKNDLRKELELELQRKQEVAAIARRIMTSDKKNIVDALVALSSVSAITRNEILQNGNTRKKLLAYYTDLVTTEAAKGNYTASQTYIDSALALFANSRLETLSLKKLKHKTLQQKSLRQKELQKQYEKILSSKEPDVEALQKIHREVNKINPDNPLVQYPGVTQTYSSLIKNAIATEDFELVGRLFTSWKILKPKDSSSEIFTALENNYSATQQAFNKRMALENRILETIKTGQVASARIILDELTAKLSPTEKQRVLNNLQEPLTAFYLQQIRIATQQDDFPAAQIIARESLAIFPKSKLLKASQQQIDKEKNNRIKTLVNNYQQALKTELPNAEEVFMPLITIMAIDPTYLEENPGLFNDLKQRLFELLKSNQTLPQVQDLLRRWDKFVMTATNFDDVKEIYRKSRNLIALRCLFNGRNLKKQGNKKLGDEYLMLGLSLDPITTVRNALEKELLK
jgi:serine/threonine protein kinase